MEPEASELFIGLTHERYKAALDPDAFSYVTGFFSDEVGFPENESSGEGFGSAPWAAGVDSRYRDRYDEDIIDLLPLIFVKGEGYETFRTRFWELMTDMLDEGFYKPVSFWCRANGKEFTAHVKGEESPFFRISHCGSCFRILRHVTVPAVDALERYPGNSFYPRIASSVAARFWNGECLAEAMGGAGWGVRPEDFVNYMLWLAGHGLRNIVLHINQFRLDTNAIHDWPPSTPCHITWKNAFPVVLEEIQKKIGEQSERLPGFWKQKDRLHIPGLLIIAPMRGVMAEFEPAETRYMNNHDGSNTPDTPSARMSKAFLSLVEECRNAGIDYELSDERGVEEEGWLENGCLKIGQRSFSTVLVSDGCRWTPGGGGAVKGIDRARGYCFDSGPIKK